MIKTVTVSGITTVDFDPEGAQPYFYAANKYVWIRNDSEDAMYASLSSTCTAGADGTAKISAGEAGMLVLSPDNTIYLSGSGAAEIRTGDTAECPFKTAAKGGDPDAVKYTEQSLTSAQQAQARTNIGAAAVSDIPSVIDYSTTEQDTGIKWLDGKSVYQKTYVFDPPATGTNVYIDLVDVSGLNIDTLIYMSGIERDVTYNNIATIETHTSGNEHLFLTADKSTVKYISPLAMEFLTLRYTKTANGNG